jgi:hypothetical protein
MLVLICAELPTTRLPIGSFDKTGVKRLRKRLMMLE